MAHQFHSSENENRCSNKNLFMNAHSSSVSINQRCSKISINSQINKRQYTYSRILCSHKRDEVEIYATTWMGLATLSERSHAQKATYDSICMRYPEQVIHKQKAYQRLLGTGRGWAAMAYQVTVLHIKGRGFPLV